MLPRLFFLFAILFLVGCESKEKVVTPEEVGPQVMKILVEMDNISRAEFRSHFISARSIRNIAKNKKLVMDKERRYAMSQVSRRDVKRRYNHMRRRLRSKGKRKGIHWSQIKRVSFRHEIEEFGGAKYSRGVLVFTSNGRKFSVQTAAIYNGSGYSLIGIHNLAEGEPRDSI